MSIDDYNWDELSNEDKIHEDFDRYLNDCYDIDISQEKWQEEQEEMRQYYSFLNYKNGKRGKILFYLMKQIYKQLYCYHIIIKDI